MVNFGQKILALQRSEWAPYYLDYNGLKQLLEEQPPEDDDDDDENPSELKSAIAPSFPSHRHDDSQLSFMSVSRAHPGSEKFLNQMNLQVEKIVLFFVQEQGRVAYKLVEARQEQAFLMQHLGGEIERIHALRVKFNVIGMELLELFKYVELNVTGIRKILKKHDKLMYWTASQYYLSGSRRSSEIIKPLLRSETMMALCVTLEAAFSELREREEEVTGILSPNLELPRHVRARSDPAAAHSLVKTDPSTGSPSKGAAEHRRNYSTAQHESFSMFKAAQHPEDAIIARIHVAQRRLKQSSEFVQVLAASALVGPDTTSRDGSFEEEDMEGPPAISNFLNLTSTFLYMTNYYIIVPTAGSYSRKLGASSSFASMLVGMTPIAALASTLLYSWWTSYSYKSALIFASTCSVIGNIFYLLGIPCNSLTYVLIGRLLNGFGSARSINRRYIADSFSHSERTAASAAFVAAGALGMAAGPGIASILHVAAQNSLSPWWQVENSPGIFMFFVWSTYLICLIIFFEDPPKRKRAAKAPAVEMTEDRKQLLGNGDASHKENGELKPLLGNGSLNTVKEEPPQWKNPAVVTTFVVYFILKLLLECLLSSTSILTKFYFGWTGSVSGVYMSLMALLMLPANLLVSKLSRRYDDRDLIMAFQSAMLVGCLLIMKYSSKYHVIQYVFGSTAVFLSTNMLEGPNMSLLSKIIPKSWSDGFFNVGLLATEAGTLGRAVGDIFLTLCGSKGMEYMLNNTFGSLFAMSFVTFLISWRYYGILQPAEKDD